MEKNTIDIYLTVAKYMNADHMHEEKLYHVPAEKPVAKYRTEIGYKIERIVERCDQDDFWQVALESLAARLKLDVDDYKSLYIKFKRRSTDMTKEELDLLCDTACKINDMHRDVHATLRHYFDTPYRKHLILCRNAFDDAYSIRV